MINERTFENIVDDTIKIWCITSSIQTLNNKTEIVFMKKSNDFIDFIPILSVLIILNKPKIKNYTHRRNNNGSI